MPILKKACCCCHLSTGGMILGWLGAVIYFCSLIYGIIVAIHIENIFHYHFDTADDERFYGPIFEVVLTIFLALTAIDVIAAVCLMIGSMKRNRFLIIPWLIGEMITIIIYGIAFLVLTIQLFINVTSMQIISTIFVFIFFIFQIYYWVCTYSLYEEIKEEENGNHYENVVVAKRQNQPTKLTTKDELPAYSALA